MKQQDFNTLPPLLVDYLHQMLQREQSTLTVREYASDLRLFFRYLAVREKMLSADTPWSEISLADIITVEFILSVTVEDAYDFLSHCRINNQNNARTRARRVVSIKRFYHYLTVNRLILEHNPMENLESPRTDKSLPKYLTLEESIFLLETVRGNSDPNYPFTERDFCILILFLNCGMRLSELCSLNVSDLRQDSTVRITGKGNKERTVYLNGACLAAIKRYRAVRPQEGLRHEDRDALFISRNKRRMNQRSVELMLEKYLKLSGLDGRGYSVHKLRHTAATLMYQNDVDVLELKEILGHENLSTTQIYTHVLDAQLREASNANPLSSFGVKDGMEDSGG
ncbi:MAG: tyrosine recombinase XerC [Oscillospiraceae bacterium]|jgi:site-specific recombinase XerD|nr:tyrosine recombinase XerC [Oscillospiraceae bacterium]